MMAKMSLLNIEVYTCFLMPMSTPTQFVFLSEVEIEESVLAHLLELKVE